MKKSICLKCCKEDNKLFDNEYIDFVDRKGNTMRMHLKSKENNHSIGTLECYSCKYILEHTVLEQ